MHAIQTSGNCIRNITADPFAGAAADEVDDPRIWSEIIRQWSTLHPEFSFLPRKFKIAVTGRAGRPRGRAHPRHRASGCSATKRASSAFEVMVGGGLAARPISARAIREFLPKRHLLSYLRGDPARLQPLGRRDNMYKARIKILVAEPRRREDSRRQVEAEWAP